MFDFTVYQGYFSSEICSYLHESLKHGWYHDLQGKISTVVTQQVKVTSNQKQVPEVAHNLSYYVYFISNNNKFPTKIPPNVITTELSSISSNVESTNNLFLFFCEFLLD